MPTIHHWANSVMHPAHDDFRHCPHCGRRTRHSIVRERVLAPVLWCLGCFHTRIGDVETPEMVASRPVSQSGAGQVLRLAG